MNDRDLDRLLAVALDAARVGGAIVSEEFGAAREVREKAPVRRCSWGCPWEAGVLERTAAAGRN